MSLYTILDWDSELFGFGVAKIGNKPLSSEEFASIMHELRRRSIRLVYWSVEPNDLNTQQLAQQNGGLLVDKKVTYVAELSLLPDCRFQKSDNIIEYNGDETCDQLEELAIQSGIYSRFNRDPHFPKAKFEMLYRLWMRNSIKRQIADVVYVQYQEDQTLGMVTLGHKNGRGDIGIIAVDQAHRGKKVGESLVKTALLWSHEQGHHFAQVVTQADNQPACKLYEKCGYQIEKVEYVYHFWF